MKRKGFGHGVMTPKHLRLVLNQKTACIKPLDKPFGAVSDVRMADRKGVASELFCAVFGGLMA